MNGHGEERAARAGSTVVALAMAIAVVAWPAPAAGELAAIHTSADSGFQVLRSYKGKVFGGTYGGEQSRVYRISKDELAQEALIGAESVSVLAACPGEACLVANCERLDKSPTVFVRDDGAASWRETGVGSGYPESEKAMGIGGGTAGGKVWASSLPYITGEPAKGYVWSSADGVTWQPGPNFAKSMPMAFADFEGKVWTGTIYGDDANGIYYLESGAWHKTYGLPDTWVSDMVVYRGSLFIATEGGIYRMASGGDVAKVTEFGGWMAVAADADGVEWLYSGKGMGWRCSGGQAELWRSSDGTAWERYQRLAECEFQGVAALRGGSSVELFAATRQEGGHGRVYYEKFVLAAEPDDAGEGAPEEIVERADAAADEGFDAPGDARQDAAEAAVDARDAGGPDGSQRFDVGSGCSCEAAG